ncbi:MAG: DUF3445 domain-containing protein [Bdellovibrionota bacterium]
MKEITRAPAQYFPFMSGVFEVAAGLRQFGTDFGNKELDQKLIQIDSEFYKYRENKTKCREENIHKYCCSHRFGTEKQSHLVAFLSAKVCEEYPEYFRLREEAQSKILNCALTQEELHFDTHWNLLESSKTSLKYLNAFDALCSQIQEDVALLTLEQVEGVQKNYLSAVHLCAAGHWSPEDKIGKDFFAVHTPVPHIEKINERAQQFADMMVHKGPFVRFVWGFSTDTRLNHHPVAPQGIDSKTWHGRSFQDPKRDQLFVRVERQVTWGLPEINSGLFTIRVSYLKGEEILKDPEKKQKLLESIQSMSPHSKKYKGLETSYETLCKYLES